MATSVKWEPLFEADANTLTMIGDGAIKLNQAIPGFVGSDTIRDLTGIKASDEPIPSVGGDGNG